VDRRRRKTQKEGRKQGRSESAAETSKYKGKRQTWGTEKTKKMGVMVGPVKSGRKHKKHQVYIV